ncbi:MAG: hypothetical protein LKE33_11600 [Acidaminococcus sp.]|jgi:hypothetical protein|nr:hypothetical protein [Acidaminococcus sp.]
MKQKRTGTLLTKKVLTGLLCAGVVAFYGSCPAFALPQTSGYDTTTEADGTTPLYVYQHDSQNWDAAGSPGDHVQIGDGGSTAMQMQSSAMGGRAVSGTGTVTGSLIRVMNNVNFSNSSNVMGGYITSNAVGSAVNNTVIMEGAAGGNYYGAFVGGAGNGSADSNTVTIRGGTSGNVYGGYVEATGTGGTNSNKVSIESGSGSNLVNGSVGGGFIYKSSGSSGDASYNTVNVGSNISVGGKIFGGNVYHGSGSAEYNAVTVAGSVRERVTGGFVNDGGGNASHNALVIEGTGHTALAGPDNNYASYGGMSISGKAEYNSATIKTGGVCESSFLGGFSQVADVTHNTALVESGATVRAAYGGGINPSSPTGDARDNALTVGGHVTASAYGGMNGGGAAENNTLVVQASAQIDRNAFGALSTSGRADGNRVTVSGTVTNTVYGGYSGQSDSADGSASNNTAVITDTAHVGYAVGGRIRTGQADGNQLTVSGAVQNTAYGGSVDSGDGTADGNSVTVTETGSANRVYGALSDAGSITGTRVTVAGTAGERIVGGWSYTGDVSDSVLELSGNTNDTCELVAAGIVTTGSGSATNGTINLRTSYSAADIYGGATITDVVTPPYPSDLPSPTTGDLVTGNKLNVHGKDMRAKSLHNFESINFYMPAGTTAGDTLLTLSGNGLVVPAAGTTVNAYADGAVELNVGDVLTLVDGKIDTSSGVLTVGNTEFATLANGVSMDYTIAYDVVSNNADGDHINIMVTGVTGQHSESTVKEQTKSFTETALLTSAMVSSGADLLIDGGMSAARDAVLEDERQRALKGKSELVPYVTFKRDNLRYNTGSHIDADGWGVNAGLAKRFTSEHRELLVGPFFEYGNADYDSYVMDGKHAEGNAHYTGGGVFVQQKQKGGLYYEGSVRAGRVTADYKSHDLEITGIGRTYEHYDYSTPYYAFHVGVGKQIALDNKSTLDAYLRYLYSHQKGFNADMTTGENYHFDAVTSSKIRTGARYTREANANSKYYVGLAYQYEFDNEANAYYHGYGTPSPSLKGSSGMLELGYEAKPSKDSNMTMDFALTGWCGKQEGVSFRLGAKWDL